jgi:hypothetical protein
LSAPMVKSLSQMMVLPFSKRWRFIIKLLVYLQNSQPLKIMKSVMELLVLLFLQELSLNKLRNLSTRAFILSKLLMVSSKPARLLSQKYKKFLNPST